MGDESTAYQMNLSTSTGGLNLTIGFDILLAGKGDALMLCSLGDLGTPSITTFRELTQKAVSKVA